MGTAARWGGAEGPNSPHPGSSTRRGRAPARPCPSPLHPGWVSSCPVPVPLAESVCPWAPTPSHCVSMGQAAGSQLVPGAALQGLLQGPNHSVHVLPGGVTAQQADPQHLGRGRGADVSLCLGSCLAVTEARAEPAGVPLCGRKWVGGYTWPRSLPVQPPGFREGAPFLTPCCPGSADDC